MDSNIITPYKNKGVRNDSNNYRDISLLSIVGKVFARVILIRLQKLAACVYPESQCGFRAERSTLYMVFSLQHLQEKCREQKIPLYIACIDRTNAFDLVSRGDWFSQRSVAHPSCRALSSLSALTRREQCSPTPASRSHSKFAAASNKSASLLQRYLGLLYPVAKAFLRHNNRRNLPSIPMAGSSTSPVSEPRHILRYARFSSGKFCLLMTQQLRPTPMMNSSH